MTTINQELYVALKSANVSDEQATAAARAVLSSEHGASKQDVALLHKGIQADMAELKAELLKWMVGGFLVQTAVLLSVLALAL